MKATRCVYGGCWESIARHLTLELFHVVAVYDLIACCMYIHVYTSSSMYV